MIEGIVEVFFWLIDFLFLDRWAQYGMLIVLALIGGGFFLHLAFPEWMSAFWDWLG